MIPSFYKNDTLGNPWMDPRTTFLVIIDNVNLELLYNGANITGNQTLPDQATAHARHVILRSATVNNSPENPHPDFETGLFYADCYLLEVGIRLLDPGHVHESNMMTKQSA